MFYVYSLLCFHERKSTEVFHNITYLLYYGVHIPCVRLMISCWPPWFHWWYRILFQVRGFRGWDCGCGTIMANPRVLGFTFCITSSLSFFIPLPHTLGFFPPSFHFPLYFHSLFTNGTFTTLGLFTLSCITGTFGTSFGFTCNLTTFWSFTVGNLLSLRWILFLLTIPDFVCTIYDLGVSALGTLAPSYHVLVCGSCIQTGCLGMRSIISLAWASW